MFGLITYDLGLKSPDDSARLRKVAKACINYGQRVQNSVFEVNLEYSKFILLKAKLVNMIDKDKDSIRFYYLGNNWHKRIEQFGVAQKYDSEGILIF